MSLTTGRGPFSAHPAGRFDPPVPGGVTYVEPFLRRVRAVTDGRVVIDSERVQLVHRPGLPPTYAFPAGDVDGVAAEAEPAAAACVRVDWDAVGQWYEEEEEVFGHPRNPYHRVESIRARRNLRVEVDGDVVVDTEDVTAVYETSLMPKLYVGRDLVRMDLLVPSPSTTYCPYKGTASYWSAAVGDRVVPDVAWSYEDPLPECLPIAGLLAFDASVATVREDVLTVGPTSGPDRPAGLPT